MGDTAARNTFGFGPGFVSGSFSFAFGFVSLSIGVSGSEGMCAIESAVRQLSGRRKKVIHIRRVILDWIGSRIWVHEEKNFSPMIVDRSFSAGVLYSARAQ